MGKKEVEVHVIRLWLYIRGAIRILVGSDSLSGLVFRWPHLILLTGDIKKLFFFSFERKRWKNNKIKSNKVWCQTRWMAEEEEIRPARLSYTATSARVRPFLLFNHNNNSNKNIKETSKQLTAGGDFTGGGRFLFLSPPPPLSVFFFFFFY